MKSEQKRTYWQQHFADWKNSKSSQKDYCQQHKLNFSTFGYWRKQLSQPKKPKSKFIQATISAPSASVILVAASFRMEIPVITLDQVLPVILRSLKASS
ncbi:MAG: hypothetical protein V3T17_08605 [Pseudomonadales bacterium]